MSLAQTQIIVIHPVVLHAQTLYVVAQALNILIQLYAVTHF
jgi:hypothetical protein